MGFLETLPTFRKKGGRGMRADVAKALREWQDAVRYFENVRDPDLVDFAIYEMEAARRKYMFLLKRADIAEE